MRNGWKARLLPVVCCALFAAGTADAKSISWTGAELIDSRDIGFPTTVPVINGDSIVFGTDEIDWAKLLTYQIKPSAPNITVSVTMNLTRLTGDWDPIFVLGDGNRLIGVVLPENISGAAAVDYADWGDRGYREFFSPSLVTGGDFPAVGESFDVTLIFALTDEQTTVYVSFLGNTGMWVGPALYRASGNDLTFAFMRDNDSGEQYQVNGMSVTVVTCQNPASARCVAVGVPSTAGSIDSN